MIAWLFYFLIGISNLLLVGFYNDVYLLLITRLLLMPILFLVWKSNGGWQKDIGRLVAISLFFSWIGDALLTFSSRGILFFGSGLFAFLLAHLFYIIVFLKENKRVDKLSFFGQKPFFVWPFLLIGVALIYIYYPGLGDLKIPVICYATCIVAMFAASFNRINNVPRNAWILTFFGAFLFVFSDSIIGYSKFVQPIKNSSFLIMLTYILGQGLIVCGLLQSKKI